MSYHTHIEWTDATWNPITGCSVVSAGCKHCYAMRLAGTRLRHHPSRAGLTRPTSAGPVWTGQVRFNEAWLDQPLRWKKPRRIFVCAHGDLFHESIPDEWIDRVFAVMALAPRHTFQVLTKRPERMKIYLSISARRDDWVSAGDSIADKIGLTRYVEMSHCGAPGERVSVFSSWPLPNVWLGTSVENQATADKRIPLLLDTPAAVRWISAEPLIGPLDLSRNGLWLIQRWKSCDSLPTAPWCPDDPMKWWWAPQALRGSGQKLIDWVIAGGESGPGARPSHPDWFRSLRVQCWAANVPFFFKQWGEWLPMLGHAEGVPVRGDKYTHPDGTIMGRAGKRAAGRRLDGRTWNEFPRIAP